MEVTIMRTQIKNLIIGSIALLFMAGICYGQKDSLYFFKAESLYKNFQYQKAIMQLDSINKMELIGLDRITYMKAICYKNLNDTIKAKSLYELAKYHNAEKYSMDFYREYYESGLGFNNNPKRSKRIKLLDKDIAEYPKYFNSYFKRGKEKFMLGNYEEALSDFKSAIKRQKGMSDLYYYRGLTQYFLGNYCKAMKDLKKAQESGNKNAEEAISEFEK